MTGPYYHGGYPLLRPGQLVLPPSETGGQSIYDAPGAEALVRVRYDERGAAQVLRRDRVYLTTRLADAELFARLYPSACGGAVYAVSPLGDVDPDPDYLGGDQASWRCPQARVVRVVRTSLKPTRAVLAHVARHEQATR